MPDPDLAIRGGGEGGRLSRPLDNGEHGVQKNFFRPFGPQFGLKVRGVDPRVPSLDPPLSADGLSIHEPIEPKI